MKPMTAREIEFVRGARAMGAFGREAYEGVSDADIANGLHGARYIARVRLSIAVNDFIKTIKEKFCWGGGKADAG